MLWPLDKEGKRATFDIAVVMEELHETVLAIRPALAHAFWARYLAGELEFVDRSEFARAAGPVSAPSGAAIIGIRGSISRRATLMSSLCGGSSVEEISDALRACLANPQCDRIILDVDSPGGAVDGIPELADEIFAARAQKPITAYVDTTAASAAYWLATQANELVVAPSGRVGSIGVFTLHLDQSRALEAAGITPTFIQAGKFKTEENPLEPLDDDAKAAIQSRVDAFYGMFVRDVARGRAVGVDQVRADFGQGRMVLAADAVKAGMADRIGTYRTAAASSARPPSALIARQAAAAAAERERIAIAHAMAS